MVFTLSLSILNMGGGMGEGILEGRYDATPLLEGRYDATLLLEGRYDATPLFL